MRANERHLDAVREAKQQRLEALEIQQATYGIDTPPHVINEIDELRRELAGVHAITTSPLSDETLRAMSDYGQLRATLVTVMGLVADMRDLKDAVADISKDSIEWRHRAQLILLGLAFLIAFVAYNSWG